MLSENIPERYNAETIITAGGAWMNRKRVFDINTIVTAKETVKVHTSEFQGKFYSLDLKQVIFENRDLLVAYKPIDLNVHAVPSSVHFDLMHGVNGYLKQQGIDFEANPHFSQETGCNVKSAHLYCVMLNRPSRRTARYACEGLNRMPCIDGHLCHFAAISCEKSGLA